MKRKLNDYRKFYQSPLSLLSLLLVLYGLWMLIEIVMGAWATYLVHVYIALGIFLWLIDLFIRKSQYSKRTKIALEVAIVLLTLGVLATFIS